LIEGAVEMSPGRGQVAAGGEFGGQAWVEGGQPG
jgi:hypothetical protein